MLLSGVATNGDIGSERTRILPYALIWKLKDLPELWYKHGSVASHILSHEYPGVGDAP